MTSLRAFAVIFQIEAGMRCWSKSMRPGLRYLFTDEGACHLPRFWISSKDLDLAKQSVEGPECLRICGVRRRNRRSSASHAWLIASANFDKVSPGNNRSCGLEVFLYRLFSTMAKSSRPTLSSRIQSSYRPVFVGHPCSWRPNTTPQKRDFDLFGRRTASRLRCSNSCGRAYVSPCNTMAAAANSWPCFKHCLATTSQMRRSMPHLEWFGNLVTQPFNALLDWFNSSFSGRSDDMRNMM